MCHHCRTKILLMRVQNAPYFNALSIKVLGSSSPECPNQVCFTDSHWDWGTHNRELWKFWKLFLKKNNVWHKHLYWKAATALCTQNSFTSDWNMLRFDNSPLGVFEKYLKDSLWVLESHKDMLYFWCIYVTENSQQNIGDLLKFASPKLQCSKFRFKAMISLLPSRQLCKEVSFLPSL